MLKRILLITIFAVTVSFAQTNEEVAQDTKQLDTNKVIVPEAKHKNISRAITQLLSKLHFNNPELNDSVSVLIFNKYLEMLDYSKTYFLEKDVNFFKKVNTKMDDFIKLGKVEPAYDIFNVFKERFNQRMAFAIKQINKGFDFTIDESVVLDREDAKWAKTPMELDEIWRKRLKHEALNLKLTDKEPEKITDVLVKRYERLQKRILQYNAEDVFQLFMNSYSNVVDPHTSYFSPITSDNFKINMSLSLEGIGAQLRSENDYTTIANIIPGGPAAKSNQLFEEDRIVAVAQADTGEMVDVVGWRLDDVVQLIRGKKGSVVRLNILRADATLDMAPEEIRLVRDKVKLEEQSASKKVFKMMHDGVSYKLGVIDIPTFYIDFEARSKGEADYKSTTRDVKKLVKELKKEKVDGIIIDLRHNGGGSLDEAIDLTGLFIEEGPVVQVKQTGGKIDVGADTDPEILYDGPLAVMVNRHSASASEIFSGAIQDYGRGLIIGETTFGKGTVQNLLDLKRFIPYVQDKLGELKLTRAKFYRITGSSTQHKGVHPDISYPSPYEPGEIGESSYDSALPWDQIDSTEFVRYADLHTIIPKLKEMHEKRIINELEFQYMIEDINELIASKDKKEYSLNEEKRKAERKEREEKKEKREAERAKFKKLGGDENQEIKFSSGDELEDIGLEEAGFILADFIKLKKVG